MKRFMILLLAGIMVLSLASCGLPDINDTPPDMFDYETHIDSDVVYL